MLVIKIKFENFRVYDNLGNSVVVLRENCELFLRSYLVNYVFDK